MPEQEVKKDGRGGKREGAGRPRGARSFTTEMREAMINEIRGRTHDVTRNLFNAQMTLATGQTFLFKIEKEFVEPNKTYPKGYWRSLPAKRVTELSEIEEYLDYVVREENDEIENEEKHDKERTFYYITTKEPNNQAIDSLLDRTLGTAVKITEISGPGGTPITPPAASDPIIKEIAQKVNELHRGASVAGYGALASSVDAEIPN